jgi:hypothetical protein
MLGATIYDLEARLLQKDIKVVDKLNISVGTEKYKFTQDIRQYKEKITPEHLQTAKDFALKAISKQDLLILRLKGVCGKDCQTCQEYNKSCKGAGYSCWSGAHCEIFDCCVTKKSFLTCGECNFRLNCDKLKNVKCNFA